jgi:hypothetical protein
MESRMGFPLKRQSAWVLTSLKRNKYLTYVFRRYALLNFSPAVA